ncbi:ATP-grasp domain-containing protein [Streptomyces sp. TLI_171]|uniref:ATP-grasp domain-containing protein n=1 Tax=Streptomyces sp. TLI_171 TaxID=1938859 RepID=UPI000C19C876|nr:ATP-grasp domain-containing protein [Streptomyces sp. TLI_171]
MELLAVEAAARGIPVRAAEEAGLTGPAHWYGGPVAGARLAGRLGFALLEPTDDWLAELPEQFTGRQIRAATVADARAIDRPTFVKPPRDKSFPADIHTDGSRLSSALDPATPVLLSDVVTFAAEYRLFLLDGRIAAATRYAVFGRLDPRPLGTDRGDRATAAEITEFTDHLVATAGHTLPSAVVVDVGQLLDPYRPGHRWAVVEANMAWFSHAYAADPARVLDVVLRAAGPREHLRPRDLAFER